MIELCFELAAPHRPNHGHTLEHVACGMHPAVIVERPLLHCIKHYTNFKTVPPATPVWLCTVITLMLPCLQAAHVPQGVVPESPIQHQDPNSYPDLAPSFIWRQEPECDQQLILVLQHPHQAPAAGRTFSFSECAGGYTHTNLVRAMGTKHTIQA